MRVDECPVPGPERDVLDLESIDEQCGARCVDVVFDRHGAVIVRSIELGSGGSSRRAKGNSGDRGCDVIWMRGR